MERSRIDVIARLTNAPDLIVRGRPMAKSEMGR
jgi:hypothetical protein